MREDDSVVVEKTSSGLRRWIIYAVLILAAFLLGFVPMFLQKRQAENQLSATQNQLGKSEIKGLLTAAIVDARRGEYEPARLATSDFYTRLRTEIDKGDAGIYSSGEREKLQSVFTNRDTIITMLAQRDQASPEKLTEMYNNYQSALGQAFVPTGNSSPSPQPANK
jgi:acyl-CoA synthetase (AMP-forming)/AMP-acid ligase II